MRTTWVRYLGLGVVLAAGAVFATACGSDDSGGGNNNTGGTSGSGGSGGSDGGGATGGGGTGGASGSGGSAGGCPAAPTTAGEAECNTCQDDQHLDCACDAEIVACTDDSDCSAIWDCVVADPACGEFTVDCALAIHQCIAANSAGKAKYLAMEKCGSCAYCGVACETTDFCAALDNPPDGGGSDGGGDASTDSSSDSATD